MRSRVATRFAWSSWTLTVVGYGSGLELAGELLFYAIDVLVLVSVVSVFLRLRHARGTTRRQIEWLVYAAALLGIVVHSLPPRYAGMAASL